MRKIEIDSFQQKISIKRILGNITGKKTSPSVIAIGGIHGNEKAGVFALKNVVDKIKEQGITLSGNFYAISGNLNALKENIRFETEDLNRIWTHDHIDYIRASDHNRNADVSEQIDLYRIIKDILANDQGPFYFIDLHTTSAETTPFITISDSLENRKFIANFSIPAVLGIEEYLDGPLLTFINEFGHIALGFEAGQHDDDQSIVNCEAFLWMTLVASGCLHKGKLSSYDKYKNILSLNGTPQDFYEIDYRYLINDQDDFIMVPGFKNFDSIHKGQIMALANNIEVKAVMNGMIFMPLYQKQGLDGFFIITKISKFWLQLSAVVRKLKLYHLLRVLPGIKKDPTNSYTLIVDPKIAKFLALELFHLFGYRKQVIKDNKLHFIKRDRKISEFR